MPDSTRGLGTHRSGEIDARLGALIGLPEVSAAYVRFRLDLLAVQREARLAMAAAISAAAASGQPEPRLPVGPADVDFPIDILATLLGGIHAAAARHGQETADLQRLRAGACRDPGRLPSLAAAAAFGPDLPVLEQLAREWGVLTDALLFVGRAMAAPCITEAVLARAMQQPAPAARDAHRCPACGSPPSVARLRRADGRRLVTCGLCGSEWEAVRTACACCGTQDQALLGVLRLGEADARWLDTCEGCLGYIKTVDERRLSEGDAVLAVVEESATLHLDLLAEREGYVRRVPYVLPA
jgi:FdhE protein